LVLYNIKRIYQSIRIDYEGIEKIRENADSIIDKVVEDIYDKINKASNKLDDLDQETLNFGLMIVIVDAFMRCNILEEPPKSK
jgi:uncharacterized membrane protein YjjP (DUF1212 family)